MMYSYFLHSYMLSIGHVFIHVYHSLLAAHCTDTLLTHIDNPGTSYCEGITHRCKPSSPFHCSSLLLERRGKAWLTLIKGLFDCLNWELTLDFLLKQLHLYQRALDSVLVVGVYRELKFQLDCVCVCQGLSRKLGLLCSLEVGSILIK